MMTFLVIPFIFLGALAILSAWQFSRRLECQGSAILPSSIIVFAIASGMLGLVFSLYGFNRSLWLDEFGTLWTVGGDWRQVMQRAFSFHGQSPFYYLIVWAFTQLLGVSEVVLRLPSLLFGVATALEIYLLGTMVGNQRAGMVAASLIWISPAMVKMNADARPYALALFMTATMFYGFFRSTQCADRKGRCLFIAGGVGLFCTHYLLALVALGMALAYLYLPALRVRYLAGQFVRDIGLQLLLVAWALPQLAHLWSRRTELSWLGDPNYLAFFELAGPFIISGLISGLATRISPASDLQRATLWVFWISLITQIAILELLGYLGANLLERRYMASLLIPAVMIAAITTERMPRKIVIIPLGYWVIFTGVAFALNFRAYETFSTAGFQNWRHATACLEKLTRPDTKLAILFRSGFVEDDLRTHGQLPQSVVLSPLHGLGIPLRSWNLVPLTYSWSSLRRSDYLTKSVEPSLREVSIFYFLTCANCFNEATGKYPELLLHWVENQFPGRFVPQPIDAGRGITLIRFADRTQAVGLESISQQDRRAKPNDNTSSNLERKHACD